jgi:hypothetical protein
MNKIIFILALFLTTPVFAGDFVCHDGTGNNLYKRTSCGKSCSSDSNCIRADRLTNIIDKKIANSSIVDKTQAEIDAEILAQNTAKEIAEDNAIDDFDVEKKEVWRAWLQVFNSKVPASYRVTAQELKAQIKANR